jgi:hypothetical protein
MNFGTRERHPIAKFWPPGLNGGIPVEVVISPLNQTVVFLVVETQHLDEVRHRWLLPGNQAGGTRFHLSADDA